MLVKLVDWAHGIDWWAVCALLAFLAAGIITTIDIFDGVDNSTLFRNGTAWLNSGALLCALFSLRDSLFGLRNEQMRRAYDPDLQRKR